MKGLWVGKWRQSAASEAEIYRSGALGVGVKWRCGGEAGVLALVALQLDGARGRIPGSWMSETCVSALHRSRRSMRASASRLRLSAVNWWRSRGRASESTGRGQTGGHGRPEGGRAGQEQAESEMRRGWQRMRCIYERARWRNEACEGSSMSSPADKVDASYTLRRRHVCGPGMQGLLHRPPLVLQLWPPTKEGLTACRRWRCE